MGNENELKTSDESNRDRETQRGEKEAGEKMRERERWRERKKGVNATPIFAPVALVVQRYK
jgi:hypothetical protein